MKGKVLILLVFIISCYFINVSAQQGISEIDIIQHSEGKYKIRITMADSLPDDTLKDHSLYHLWEKKTGAEVKLPEPELWEARPGRGVRFTGVDITYKKQYIIQFDDFKADIQSSNFTWRNGQKSFDEFEQGKAGPWQTSFKPKIAQGDSTIRELGDLGFELFLSKELPKKFKFRFTASVTANKNDPSNDWTLDFSWRHEVWQPLPIVSLRPLRVSITEEANQGLTLHDLSVSAFTSISVQPFDGIEPVWLTAGLGPATRVARDSKDYDDPRFHLQMQWGMVGLVGRGAEFLIDWEYWRRLDDFGDPKIDPSLDKERQYIELQFSLPILDNKNLTVKYANGHVPPTFARNTSVHIGLEFLFGGYRALVPK